MDLGGEITRTQSSRKSAQVLYGPKPSSARFFALQHWRLSVVRLDKSARNTPLRVHGEVRDL